MIPLSGLLLLAWSAPHTSTPTLVAMMPGLTISCARGPPPPTVGRQQSHDTRLHSWPGQGPAPPTRMISLYSSSQASVGHSRGLPSPPVHPQQQSTMGPHRKVPRKTDSSTSVRAKLHEPTGPGGRPAYQEPTVFGPATTKAAHIEDSPGAPSSGGQEGACCWAA